MKRKCQGKMGIFITHRVENIKDLDPKIIVFSNGKIVGDSKHHELINNCDEYARLFNIDVQIA